MLLVIGAKEVEEEHEKQGNERLSGVLLMGAMVEARRRERGVGRWLPVLLVLLWCFLHFPSMALAVNKVTYKGVTPGISTVDDTLRMLGKPVAKVISDERIVCKYRYVQVNILKKTSKVMFILIYDPDFKDVNGFSLGSSYAQIYEKLGVEAAGNTVADLENGIGYIFSADGIVEQIVYGMVR